uniref:COG complex component COG2 C-terminal domain-containing protein n=1 Tax=Globodera rostochiensis TaxID=31243 RepID=A0A914GZW2_GLORO
MSLLQESLCLNCVVAMRFSAVLTPSDSQLFHCCYRHISDFVAKWPSRGSAQRGLFHSILEKFNLVVFFKLASQPLLNPLRALSAPESFEIQMDLYIQWAQKLTDHFSCPEVPEDEKSPPPTENRSNRSKSPNLLADLSSLSPTNCQQKVPNWLQLSALYRDLYLFDAALFRFCLNTIWTYLRELRVDTTPFGQCLSRFSEQLAQKKTVIAESISSQLGAELTKNLSAVGDIPRQYRWTKRPFPVGFSAYLSKAFVVCEEFSEKSKEFGWTDVEVRSVLSKVLDKSVDGFCDKAEKVLESVEQTGSSLLRFKQRKMGHLQPQHEGETDEAKIRAQIRLDTNFVRQRTTVDYGMDEIERLAKVEERASSVNAEGGIKVEERASSVNAEGVI